MTLLCCRLLRLVLGWQVMCLLVFYRGFISHKISRKCDINLAML